jgi:hypothetical protein
MTNANWAKLAEHLGALSVQRKKMLAAVVCLLLGLAILVAGSWFIDTNELHLYGILNDQIGYITVARNLVTKGTLQSNTIVPSTLWQRATNDLLYMPGHPAAIALSYRLFGIGAFQSIIPSLVSYLVAMLAIFLIGTRCYSSMVGLVASLLFALFPPVLFFAYTAMAELTFLAAFTAAVCACLYLPDRFRPWLGPFCLAVPFLFRETAALVAPALGFYFWLDGRSKPAWRTFVFVVLSVVLLGALFRSDFSAGRPSLLTAHIFGDLNAVYYDALAQQAVSHPRWQDWVRVLPARATRNLKFLFFASEAAPWEGGSNYVLIAAIAFVGLIAVLRADKLAYSFSAFSIIAGTALVVLYAVSDFRGMRYLLFTYALNVVVIASLLVRIGSKVCARRLPLVVAASASVVAMAVLSLGVVRGMSNWFTKGDVIDRKYETILETIGHDDTRMLVTPPQMSVRYRYYHFPVDWAFLPHNLPTLKLLAARFDIGTLVLDNTHQLLQEPSTLAGLGFYKDRDLTIDGVHYVVYKRPAR